MLDTIAAVLGAACFFGCIDRLRCLSWRTSRPTYVAAYLALTLWSMWIFDRAVKADLEWYQVIGIAGIVFCLVASKNRWRHGPPADVSRPAALDEPMRRLFK